VLFSSEFQVNSVRYRVGEKSLTSFTPQLKIASCQGKHEVNLFDWYIHKVCHTAARCLWISVA
jgi:hypothetical protein